MNQWWLILSDIFSIITIALCLILKLPQIIRLVKSGEAVGVSLRALLLELFSYTVTLMYNYTNRHALLTYMEYPIIVIQEYILIMLVMYYKGHKPRECRTVLLGFIFMTIAFNYYPRILTLLVPLTTPMGATSKLIQLREILIKKNATSVSVFTWFLSFFTNFTRIYTVYLDSADSNLLLNFSVSSVLSGCVTLAALYYQKISPVAERKAQ